MKHGNIQEILSNYDTFLFDCDGVLWTSATAVPGARNALENLRELGKKVFFVTNNSTKSRNQYLKKFKELNFQASEDEILSSSFATAQLLKSKVSQSGQVFVLGEGGIHEECKRAQVKTFSLEKDIDIPNGLTSIVPRDNVEAVVVGMDRSFNYDKVALAQFYINRGAPFYATNADDTFPMGGGLFLPGGGVVVASVERCAGVKAEVIGKPSRTMLSILEEQHSIDLSKAVMVGDRLETDIQFASANGIDSILVATGVATEEQGHQAPTIMHPTYFVPSVGMFAAEE